MAATNILKALVNIVNSPQTELLSFYSGRNRINNVGMALEEFVQDAFAGTIHESNPARRKQRISEVFSYIGNQNNPPDIIISGGDAIEVKKIQNFRSAIALNSSYPKHKLYVDDPRITEACRNCERWKEKDIIYVVGVTTDVSLRHLWFVYGDCYAASPEVYSRITNTISTGINTIEDVEFSETRELGRVNRVDPLGITYLRIRGMWHIENPFKVYQEIYSYTPSEDLQFACLMRKSKFESLPEEDKNIIVNNERIYVQEVTINNPDNPANLLDAVLICRGGGG